MAMRMHWNALANPESILFVHYDKNIYTNREYAWFTAYLLQPATADERTTLAVALIRNDDRSILSQEKFVMQNGIAHGCIFVPDSLPTGNYSFIAYTDILIDAQPIDLFIQPVTIKTVNNNAFIATLNLNAAKQHGLDSMQVILKAYTRDASLVKDAAVKFYIGNRDAPLSSLTTRTNNFGEASFYIPLKKINAANNELQAEISNGKELKAFNIRLPVYHKMLKLSCYPEGGYLSAGLLCTVGIECINSEGEPMQIKGDLYEDATKIKQVETDAYGIGAFNFVPNATSHYFIRVTNVPFAKDTAYVLPVILKNTPVIRVENAITNDTLSVRINRLQPVGPVTLVVHDYKRVYLETRILNNHVATQVKISLHHLPKGLKTLTVLDSSGQPVCERIFFAHYNQKPNLIITTDTIKYQKRQKVTLQIQLKDKENMPMVGLFSISCAKDNRFDVRKTTDIESYAYLESEMHKFPFRNNNNATEEDNKAFLENMLLVRSWRKYDWQQIMYAAPKDTILVKTPVVFGGQAILPGKHLKKPLNIRLTKGLITTIVKADTSGKFQLPAESLVIKPSQSLRMVADDNRQEKFRLTFKDPYTQTNERLAKQLTYPAFTDGSFDQSSQTYLIPAEERAKRLTDVLVITNKRGNYAANECGDYVCVANVLNCPNHITGGTMPTVGATYNTGVGKVVYQGCEGMKYLTRIKGIYTARSFYSPDYANPSLSTDALISTLYWNHGVLTNESGTTALSFYTNDNVGKFRIVVQGITAKNGVVYGVKYFTVE